MKTCDTAADDTVQNAIVLHMQVEPSSELRKVLQAASKLQKKKGDSFLGACADPFYHFASHRGILPRSMLQEYGHMLTLGKIRPGPWFFDPVPKGSILCQGVNVRLVAVLNSPEVSSALEEAGISGKQLAAAVEELRGSSTKVGTCRACTLCVLPVYWS